jgi:hypothetical protein
MNKSRRIGDQHLDDVHYILNYKLQNGNWPKEVQKGPLLTAQYIIEKFPNIKDARYKFDYINSDQYKDLTLVLENKEVDINLFLTRSNSPIQPKNLGAKSFLEKYFLSENLQNDFNTYLNKEHLRFLRNLVQLKEGNFVVIKDQKELRQKVKTYYKKFDEPSNEQRNIFLYNLREYCFSLIQNTYNSNATGFVHAYKSLLMIGEVSIITRILKSKVKIEEFKPTITAYENIKIYKKGSNSIGIQYGSVALILRFKFENKPNSSIKLATSYEVFKDDNEFINKNYQYNVKTVKKVDNLIKSMTYQHTENTSNAIGKCHEALTYYWFLNKIPNVIQADDSECLQYINNYAPYIKPDTFAKIQVCSSKTVDAIIDHLTGKYTLFNIESVELVADIYLTDKLNTADLKVSIKIDNETLEEVYISLKALKTKNQKITTKNPGIGSILGPKYFNVRDISETVAEVKEDYLNHNIDHQESLIRLSNEIGINLEQASQKNLRQGLKNLLGSALMIVAIYEHNECYCVEHSQINTFVKVLRSHPTAIQNTLTWNNEKEQLSLRIKFSRGHHHGWSSVKLVSEYQVNYDIK